VERTLVHHDLNGEGLIGKFYHSQEQVVKINQSITGTASIAVTKLLTQHRLRLWFPLVIFLLATFFIAYPVSRYPASLIYGRPFEDAFEAIGVLYWYKHALFDLGQFPLFRPDVFYPFGWDLRFTSYPWFYPLLIAPITAIAGPVFTYNLAILGSCIFAALGMFMVVRAIGGGMGAGILAGLAFAFYPQREVYLAGFFNFLIGSMWLPWSLYGIIRASQVADRPTRWIILAFLSYALAFAGAWQLVFLGGAVLIGGAWVYWLPVIRRSGASWIRPMAWGVAAWCLVALPMLGMAFLVWRELGSQTQFVLTNIEYGSVSIERLFVPSALNPLWWNFARKTFPLWNGPDSVVIFGYTTIVLGLLGLIKAPRGRIHERAALILWLGAVVFMLGPTLRFWGKPVSLALPPDLLSGVKSVSAQLGVPLVEGGATHIPLPWLLLYLLFPPIRTFHGQGRWGLVGMLGLATLAALGLTKWTQRLRPGMRFVINLLAVILLLIEFNTQPLRPVISTTEMHRSVDDWLAANASSSVIIEYPFSYTMKGQSLYYIMAHGQKIVHGYSNMRSKSYDDMIATLDRWPELPAIDKLQQIGVRYVLVHAFNGDNFEEKQLPALLAIPQLHLVGVFPTPIGSVRQIYLFELRAPA